MTVEQAKQIALELATGGYTVLCEIVWDLYSPDEDLSDEETLTLARAAVARLFEKGYISICYISFYSGQVRHRELEAIPPHEVPAVLRDPSSWAPGKRMVAIIATEAGKRAYFSSGGHVV